METTFDCLFRFHVHALVGPQILDKTLDLDVRNPLIFYLIRCQCKRICNMGSNYRTTESVAEESVDQARSRAEIHARFASDMRPLLEEFGRATAVAANETEVAIDRNKLAEADGRPDADENGAVGGASATTASVIVHHAAVPDQGGQPAGAQRNMGEKDKFPVDQVAVEIVNSEVVVEPHSDNEDGSSRSGKRYSKY